MKGKITLAIIGIGLILVLISVRPLFLIVQESIIDTNLSSKYDLEKMINIRNESAVGRPFKPSTYLSAPLQWEGNTIEVLTQDTGIVAPNDTNDSRFLSWLNIVKVNDKDSNQEKLAIVQRTSGYLKEGDNLKNFIKAQSWRITYVNQDKSISEESFSYPDKGNHLLGMKLVLLSSQSTILMGYRSDINTSLPSLFFPLVYPTSYSCLYSFS